MRHSTTPPATVNLKLRALIVCRYVFVVLDSGRFAEVTRNLDSKFAAVSPPSVPLSHSLVSPPRYS